MKIENFGPINLLELKLQNPFRNFFYKQRRYKLTKFWNKQFDYIDNCIKIYDKESNSTDGFFKWSQLVYQECWMYCKLGEKVNQKELDELSKERGFDIYMENFLKELLVYVNLWKKD
jgi:hypothetical protein